MMRTRDGFDLAYWRGVFLALLLPLAIALLHPPYATLMRNASLFAMFGALLTFIVADIWEEWHRPRPTPDELAHIAIAERLGLETREFRVIDGKVVLTSAFYERRHVSEIEAYERHDHILLDIKF